MNEHTGWGSHFLKPTLIYEIYFTNPPLVNDVHDSKIISDVVIQSFSKLTKQKSNVYKWGKVWFNKNGISKTFV